MHTKNQWLQKAFFCRKYTTQPQHMLHNAKNTNTMISPTRRLPGASILWVSVIAVCCAMDLDVCNTRMQFIPGKIMNTLLYLLLFCRPLTSALVDNRFFYYENFAFFMAVASSQLALIPAIRQCIFCQHCLSPHHVLE
jgi:hypothetical protein